MPGLTSKAAQVSERLWYNPETPTPTGGTAGVDFTNLDCLGVNVDA